MTEILQETVRELGFPSVEDFLSLKIIEELEKKVQSYETDVKAFEKKYEMVFPLFKKSLRSFLRLSPTIRFCKMRN